ncbi:electron transfer flavoprotein beta subunit lysine methyltransferase-like isoform X2 [Lytechinus pictus]|uniref:electron transfer flavoprotein beta subunit lysine methyltransferase-like isoform X2 n=1 Tax=Lytechinus pictus TaxID=7653 RepID=UPI0030B9E3EE
MRDADTMTFLRRLSKFVSNPFSLPYKNQKLSGILDRRNIFSFKGYLYADSFGARLFGFTSTPVTPPYFTQTNKSCAARFSSSKHSEDGIPATTPPGCSKSDKSLADLIMRHTQATRDHLTPEIALSLITRECPLWHETTDQCPFNDPFWAFYWPGGQALTRFILDHPELVEGRSVLDVGSGCGASAIAASMRGASRVLANDIDPVAIQAMKLNAVLNGITMDTTVENLIHQPCQENSQWDLVLLGDMFYDRDFTNLVADWLISLIRKHKSRILIGDPGRVYLRDHPMRENLIKLFEISLPSSCVEENRGHSSGYVWEFVLF